MYVVVRLLFLVASLQVHLVEPFNVDLRVPLLKSYDSASGQGTNIAFGASVAIRIAKQGTSFIVGAPKANTTSDSNEPGSVFQCDIDNSPTCRASILNPRVLNANTTTQLFGQIVKSVAGHTVVCAPRYQQNWSVIVETDTGQRPLSSFYATGRCIGFSDDGIDLDGAQLYGIAPCYTLANSRPNDFSSCGFGLDVDIDKNGEFLAFGSPGAVRATGDVFYAEWGQVLGEDVTKKPVNYDENRADGLITNYLGFSVAVGKFSATEERFVAGAPKKNDYLGEVLMFKRDQTQGNEHILIKVTLVPDPPKGDQFGAMFGYAIVAADLDGSGLSEIVVSAPYYGTLNQPNVGRIYVYKLSAAGSGFDSLGGDNSIIDGMSANGLFGLTMSTLNDVNMDGFDDIAVSAPFEGNGVVYIFNGYSQGLRKSYQRIESQDVPGMMMPFGFGLSKGEDVDQNKYPDFVVGAYKSNNAILFRSRPVVAVHTSISTNTSSISLIEDVSPGDLCQGMRTTCFQLTFCIWYENRPNADPISTLELMYTLTLDKSENQENRLLTIDPADNQPKPSLTNQITLSPSMANQMCQDLVVYLKENIRDKSSSFKNTIEANLLAHTDTRPTSDPASPNTLPDLYPIIDRDVLNSAEVLVTIARNCPAPPDDKCTPDLQPRFITLPSEIVAGSDSLIEIVVEVENNFSDPSFQTQLVIEFPKNLVYINSTLSTSNSPLLGCSSTSVGALCDIGNPLFPFTKETVRISLQQRRDDPFLGNESVIEIHLNATSEDGDFEGRSSDNVIDDIIKVVAETELVMSGLSQVSNKIPPQPPNIDPRTEVIIQPALLGTIIAGEPTNNTIEIAHRYSIRNEKQTGIPRVEASFWFPYYDVKNEVTLIENIAAGFSPPEMGNCDVTFPDNQEDEGCSSLSVKCAKVDCGTNVVLVQFGVLSISVKGTATLARITSFASSTGSTLISSDVALTSQGTAKIGAGYLPAQDPVSAKVKTSIQFTIQRQECVQIWYIVVSVIGSLLVLTIIIFVLYSCGFFKMKKTYDLSEGGMIAKKQGPRDETGEPTPPPPPVSTSSSVEKRYSAPSYEEPKRISQHRSSQEYPPSEPRRSRTSLPPSAGMKELDEEPMRRTSRVSGMKVFDEEPGARRPISGGGEGGVVLTKFEREPRRSVASGNDVDGRSSGPSSPRKYTETIM